MSLISPPIRTAARRFAAMTRPVRLLFFTQTLDCETCLQTRQILDELPPLSDRITIEEVNFVLEPDKAKQYGIDRVPAIAVVGQDDAGAERDSQHPISRHAGRLRVHLADSAPCCSSAAAVACCRRRACALIAAVDTPMTMHVFTTPTCPHCPARRQRSRTRWRWRTRTSPPTPSRRRSSRISPAAIA